MGAAPARGNADATPWRKMRGKSLGPNASLEGCADTPEGSVSVVSLAAQNSARIEARKVRGAPGMMMPRLCEFT